MNVFSRTAGLIGLALALLLPTLATAAALPEFRDIVKKSSPAVVKIVVEHSAARDGQGRPGPEDIPEHLRRFFEFRGAPPSQRQRMGMGSGFYHFQRRLYRHQ